VTERGVWPVLLSGGSGTRLWPLSRADMPKQLKAVAHEETMLQATALRVRGGEGDVAFRAPLIVCGGAHRFMVGEQLMAVGINPSAIILEPQGRNTAPAIALAAHQLAADGRGDDLMLILPSDHLIADEAAFRAAVAAAIPAAEAGRLVTFGILPSEPMTGYGYIQPASTAGQVRPVARFVEKPDAATAERYVSQGYLWNAGIFLFRAATVLELLEAHAAEVASAVAASMAEASREGMFVLPDGDAFATSPSISIDYALLERAPGVVVVPVDMGWSDVGSWDALWRVQTPDEAGNVLRGAGELIDCRDSLVRVEGGPFVAALGLNDMVVVSTADAVLIAPRAEAENIRRVVEAIEARGLDLARASHEVHRPWGSYRTLASEQGWQVKRIVVKPGGRLSLQKHGRRAETWVVASGLAEVTVGEERRRLGPGEAVEIPLGAVHRLENPGPRPLELIEVQRGSYLGEDDIVRLSDIYGRAGGPTSARSA